MRGLYAIVDPEQCAGRDPVWVAREILRGGCAALQLRAKQLSDDDFLALGRQLVALSERAGVPLFVNDRVALVTQLAAGGTVGVHLGQTDMPIEAARAVLGSHVMIGVSTHDLAQARDAQACGADLIGVGPVFATQTKQVAEPVVGVAGLHAICRAVTIPVVAIGGINLDTAPRLAETGVPLGAAISALCAVPDPERSAAELHRVLSASL